MNLLNAALAFGALAFSIPLVIHLLFRSRFKTVDWGAMYLLENVVRTNRRRMQLANWLLLLLRCLIPVILAFCLARPVWTGLQALAGDAPRTLVIALDDSRSMAAIPPGGQSRIEVAKQELRQVLDGLTRRDEIILVRSSQLGAVPSKMGVSDAMARLRKVNARGGNVTIGQLIDAAVAATQDASHPRSQILVVSDFQNQGIDSSSLDVARQVTQRKTAQRKSGAGEPWVIDLLDVGDRWDDLTNVSIDQLEVRSPVVTAKRAGVYAATLRNASELPANDLRLVWSIDGKPLEPRVISVDAKATVTNRLTHAIESTGMHEITATISRPDGLIDDNRRSIAVEVMDEIDVVVLEGTPGKKPLEGQADFLAIALSPFAFGGDERPDPVNAVIVAERRLGETLDQSGVRVLILAGAGKLRDATKQRIADFVADGGALVMFDGPEVKPDVYNRPWEGDGFQLTFPAILGDLVGSTVADRSKTKSGEMPGASFAFDKPASLYLPWRILARGEENPLSDVRLNLYRKLTVRDPTDPSDGNDVADTQRYVLLRTAGGDPLCVLGRYGEGTVVQFAIAATDRWSNLPLRPLFLPFVQQMVLDLAGKQGDAVMPVGEPIVVQAEDFPKLPLESESDARVAWSVRTPSGQYPIEAPTEDEPVRITTTYEPGLYLIEKRITQSGVAADPQVARSMRVVSVEPGESLLVDAGSQRIAAVAESLDATVHEGAAELRSADRLRSFGREIWRWLLVLLLVGLVAELWLQQNLVSRRSDAGGTA